MHVAMASLPRAPNYSTTLVLHQLPQIPPNPPSNLTPINPSINSNNNNSSYSYSFKSGFGHISSLCKHGRIHEALHSLAQFHAQLIKNNAYNSDYIQTKLAILYAKCGASHQANTLFRTFPKPNLFSWAAIVSLHSRTAGRSDEALRCFVEMMESGFLPDNFLVPNALKACGVLGWVGFGKGLHGYVVKMMAFDGCVFVATSLADMYGKCGVLGDAEKVFDGMLERNVVAWNSMIAVYAQNGMNWEAIELFRKMLLEGVELTPVALASFLSACADLGAVGEGRQGHALAVLGGFELDGVLGSSIMNLYSKVGLVDETELVFGKMAVKDVVTWNLIISGYVRAGQVEKAIEMCYLMREENMGFDQVTLSSLLTVAADARDVGLGMEGHGYCIKNNFDSDVVVSSGIIDVYAKCGRVDYARRVFDSVAKKDVVTWNTMLAAYADLGLSSEALKLFSQMQQETVPPNVVSWNSMIFSFFRNGQVIEAQNMFSEMCSVGVKPNVITWTTVISGLAQNGLGYEALLVFRQMQEAGIRPNSISITSALSACPNMAFLKYGKAIHGYITRHGMSLSVHITTSIMDMYAKCGTLDNAECVFTMCSRKQIHVYNAMISAYASYGQAIEALACFQQLEKEGMVPDPITLTSLLSACCHARLVKEGLGVFKYMVSELQMKPSAEHYGCLIKLLANDGQLDEALRIILTMPSYPDAHILGSLLASCEQNQEIELASHIAKWLLNLDPKNSGNYVALSNLYATVGRWDDVSNIRGLMKEEGLRKIPGCSWIEVGRELHVFIASDRSHPVREEIYMILNLLGLEMQHEKYTPI